MVKLIGLESLSILSATIYGSQRELVADSFSKINHVKLSTSYLVGELT